jgi:hypothetical protein
LGVVQAHAGRRWRHKTPRIKGMDLPNLSIELIASLP